MSQSSGIRTCWSFLRRLLYWRDAQSSSSISSLLFVLSRIYLSMRRAVGFMWKPFPQSSPIICSFEESMWGRFEFVLVGFVMAGLMDDQVLTRRAMFRRIYIFTRVAYITRIGMWFPISLDSCLYCEDVIKPKLIYRVLMRPKTRPTHVSALN